MLFLFQSWKHRFYQQNIYLEITPCMNPALFQFRLNYFQNTPCKCTLTFRGESWEVKAPVTQTADCSSASSQSPLDDIGRCFIQAESISSSPLQRFEMTN